MVVFDSFISVGLQFSVKDIILLLGIRLHTRQRRRENVRGRPHNDGMNDEFPAALRNLIRLQHGTFSRAQALAAGVTADVIAARVRRGTWRRVHSGVYTISTGDLGPTALRWAALLYAGRGAVLSHQTAARLHGIRLRGPADEIHVIIPAERRVTGTEGIRIHRSARSFAAAMREEDPPRTLVSETLLDLADAADTFGDVCGWITQAISDRLISDDQLLAAVRARGKVRWRADLTTLVAAAAAGDHSALEYRYTRDVERRHGLPEPDRQVPFTKPDGRTGRRDRVYAEYGLIVELDGKLDHSGVAVQNDNKRDRTAAVAGKQTLRFGWDDVRGHSCTTAIEVAQVLRIRGWKGTPKPCSLYCQVQRAFPR